MRPAHRADGHDPMSEGRLGRFRRLPPFVGCSVDFRRCCTGALSRTLELCPGFADGGLRPHRRRCWHRATRLIPTPWGPGLRATGPSTPLRSSSPSLSGALILSVTVDDAANRMTSGRVAIDAAFGALCCISLWWRRRWPFGVALVCVLLGAFSTFGTVAGLLALSSLAVHRHVRPALLVAALFVPSAVVCSIWLGRTNTWSVMLPTAALAAAATAWGMFVRARRQLLSTLRDRAQRAEADQLVRAESARLAERTRIAREMHDVLAHRISLVALHAGALEVALDLPPAQVRESAALLRLTAHQALEELRDVIGVLREEPGQERPSTVPQPTLADIPRLVEETRRAGAKVDFEMQVDDAACRTRPFGS